MTGIVAALVLLALAAYGASLVRDDYRDGTASTVFLGWIRPLTFDRTAAPPFFWAMLAINLAVVAALTLSGLALLAVAARP